MSDHLIWFVGNRNPSITETLTYADGTVVDLTGSTVKLKMRAVGSSTLKVNAAATVVGAATLGQVRYDWAALDVDTGGFFLVWWEVTTGGKTQDLNEAIIEFSAHAPAALTYVELEEFKSTAELTGTNFADQDIRSALVSASRAVDQDCGRRFYLDADATQIRYYDGDWRNSRLEIDDLVTLTSLKTDDDGSAAYATTWTLNTDFVLDPVNAPADSRPYTKILIPSRSSKRFPDSCYYPNAVKVTGQYGWLAVPENVKIATGLFAERLVKLRREAPFGIVGLQADGSVARISRSIQDWDVLLAAYRRPRPLA